MTFWKRQPDRDRIQIRGCHGPGVGEDDYKGNYGTFRVDVTALYFDYG